MFIEDKIDWSVLLVSEDYKRINKSVLFIKYLDTKKKFIYNY